MKKYIWCIIYGLFLLAFTAYVMLDTFVITRVYTTVPSDDTDSSTLGKGSTSSIGIPNSSIITANSYTDDAISIIITEYRENDTSIYVADVKLSSADCLKTAFAENTYGKNITEKTSEIAANNNAILAINGDYYGTQERGYVLRNGVLYRSAVRKTLLFMVTAVLKL